MTVLRLLQPEHIAPLDEERIVRPPQPLKRERIRLAHASAVAEEEHRARRRPIREQPVRPQRRSTAASARDAVPFVQQDHRPVRGSRSASRRVAVYCDTTRTKIGRAS